MKRKSGLALFAVALVSLAVPPPASAQTNDDDYTPLNSRIKRARQFPTTLLPRPIPQLSKVQRDWGRAMLSQYSNCLYNRSKEDSLELLEKTDFGFADFKQIGLEQERAFKIYGFRDCLKRVAYSNASGVMLRYSPASLRQWLIQAAYVDRYPDGATWVKPGYVIAERTYPLSAEQPAVHAVMDFADCVIATDPYAADFFFRTVASSDDEKAAIDGLVPSLAPCLPDGQQFRLDPSMLRLFVGEALWHAANHNAPAPAEDGGG